MKGVYEDEFRNCPAETRVAYRTFLEWHASGSKFIAIACGGSVYALVLIAGLGLRVSISSMVGTTHLHLADMLRSPPKGKQPLSLNSEINIHERRFPRKQAYS